MNREVSIRLFTEAQKYLPGGVNSPVRAFKAVGGTPPFIVGGEGARIYDADGNSYLDYVCSWGPLILGHAHPAVVEAVASQAKRGMSFGAPCPLEVELARRLVEALPGVEMVRLVNSGTEATMSAIRLARAYTRRFKILKFEGCYHGHADSFLIKAGSGALTLGVPTSPGVPPGTAADTLVARFNDLKMVREIFKEQGEEIAAVILEPIAGNMGVVPPQPGFLEGLRELCNTYGTLLIFDEVITGFRVAYGGAQTLYGVIPDLTCLGKIIGGGLPVGAFGGRKEIMEMVAPVGPVYQAGTLSGNPLAMAAGIATLEVLRQEETYPYLEKLGKMLEDGLREALEEAGVPGRINRVGSMLTLFFTPEEVKDYASAVKSDTSLFANFFHAMLEEGVYLPPSQFEAWFISLAHKEEDVAFTVEATRRVLRKLKAKS
ncbi:glutamate-1-semialdehyde-2,1-aminomutase [Ammonifex degensii KC4]|uniref:Glutamate-1-semialdehyde 2,1-aminomutase n=1 Tax=Ammonifex degensii (strain DSM 10501 / KC4) TaxID=429009 RepID=C9R7T4_AMMDK|nr:glutamate-1-semialdehyde 2,1-aminomutase [Ammonifex degensii]ACX52363.1 glutamate-1-semialdehyde-2,1-aminomutase [Ammonifex degensii KC4]